jgi:Peptidase family C25
LLSPEPMGKIPNQDLHGSPAATLIIVSWPAFLPQAERIAQFHQQYDKLSSLVLSTEQVFNEFSSGMADPAAIRDFVKMMYDRAGIDSSKKPRYLLLLGDASYDYKDRLKNNSNLVPAYQSAQSLDPVSTYTADDFFALLDDADDINAAGSPALLDMGVGRIPAKTVAEAKAWVDKLFDYADPKSLGAWRNEQTFIADDQDQNLHLIDAEAITTAAAAANPVFLQNKIYLDAFPQVGAAAGNRYPAANQAISNQVQRGTLIWNYNGHGSYARLAEELVLDKAIVDSWTNANRLPLMITATCDFAPYDNPAIQSLGENILLREKTGAVGLLTTTRLVLAFSNRIINRNYLQAALVPSADGSYLRLGDALRQAKNKTYQTQNDIVNNRKFTLLGDPAMRLAFPANRVQTTSINGHAASAGPDTLHALTRYSVSGAITDPQGRPLPAFNGTVSVMVYGREDTARTRANDADSYQQSFPLQPSPLFKGRASVVNGVFEFSFIVPADITPHPGRGRIVYYADNGEQDGNGSFNNFLVGGMQGLSSDNAGPVVKAFLDSENFVDGGIAKQAPLLLLHLSDSSGINIADRGTGHDITAVIDGDTSQEYHLGAFFKAETDTYQKGSLRYQLPVLAEGHHTIVIKAWDVANNSGKAQLAFRITKQADPQLLQVRNYPNPFTSITRFWFEHNRPNEDLEASIRIFTLDGKLVKTIRQTINTPGIRSSDIEWNGTDEYGSRLVKGIYLYQVAIETREGQLAIKMEKLLLD